MFSSSSEQPSIGIHDVSLEIKNSCQIPEKSIPNQIVGAESF